MSQEIAVLTDVALITCVIERGAADAVVAAAQETGVQGATIHFGRGTGVRERLGLLGIAIEVEKEIVTMLVPTDQVDRVFERVYVAGELGVPGRGLMYVTELEKAATFIPHEILDKLGKERPKTDG